MEGAWNYRGVDLNYDAIMMDTRYVKTVIKLFVRQCAIMYKPPDDKYSFDAYLSDSNVIVEMYIAPT